MKNLGRDALAAEMLELYVSKRAEGADFWDLKSQPFADMVTDVDVQTAFRAKYDGLKKALDPRDVLKRIATEHSWSQDDIVALTALNVDDFVQFFHQTRDEALQRMIAAALQFEGIGGISDAARGISKRARDALARIGAESAINAERVKRYGIKTGS